MPYAASVRLLLFFLARAGTNFKRENNRMPFERVLRGWGLVSCVVIGLLSWACSGTTSATTAKTSAAAQSPASSAASSATPSATPSAAPVAAADPAPPPMIPLSQPQCADDRVVALYGEDCQESCIENCANMCTGGYCTGGTYSLCYLQDVRQCDCGTLTCPHINKPLNPLHE